MLDVQHVVSFRKGDHICLFYKDVEEQLATAAPFVKLGLLADERCLCVLQKDNMERLLSCLDKGGVDCDKQIRDGALLLFRPEEAYLAGGHFDRRAMLKLLDDGMREALALGFTGFRGTGDLSWAARDAEVCGNLPQYEQMLDRYYPGKPALGICMYNCSFFDEAQLAKIMNVHRLGLVESSSGKRSLRIRNGERYGDVVFDRISPALFHYKVQQDNCTNFLSLGQETTLTAAIAAVESVLHVPASQAN